VRDFGSWLRELHVRRQLADAASPRVLSDVEERELWRAVIDDSELGRGFLEPAGAARAARRARRVMYEYGIPLRAIAADAAMSDETQAFLDWNGQFDARCRLLGCVSADQLLAGIVPPAERIAWIESPQWRPVARQWLERHGRMLLPAMDGGRLAASFHTNSPAAELAAIAQWALAGMQAADRFRAWVCVPDLSQRRAEVIDAMDAALAPQRFALGGDTAAAPYAVAGGTALADFAPVRAALDTLAASTGTVRFEQFSALLRAPELQASAADTCAASLLDVQLRKQGPADADLSTWLTIAAGLAPSRTGGPVAAAQRLQAALRTLEEVRGDQPISRWVAVWVRALEVGPWALRHRWSSTEYQSAERFRELLAGLATADSFFGSHSRESAQRVLQRAARETLFQVQTGVPPIWISGQAADPWLTYDGLWVSGYDSERWPPAIDPVALLPVRLQREYGVIAAAAESQLHSALELQNRWLARAVQCVFSHADSADGRSSRQSPLLPRDTPPLAAMAAPAQPHWLALLDAAPLLERFDDELAPPFAADERTRGVATLRAQSRCAFRGFAETRLRTRPLERPVPGFNERERGELLHHALERIWSVLRNSNALQSASPESQSRLLDDAVAGALDKVCRLRDPGPRWRRRERERMHGVLRNWLDVERLRAAFDVEYLEQGAQVARHAGLEFAVRIDRVDTLADGGRVLIDYKSGIATADWRGERPDNPQLPIYALLQPEQLVAVAYGKVNAGECGFVAEAERGGIFRPRGQKSALEGEPSFAALVEVWAGRLERLAADFAAGVAAVAPTLKACRSCRLQGLCRVPAALEEGEDLHG
jgi:probable DNA repair protein